MQIKSWYIVFIETIYPCKKKRNIMDLGCENLHIAEIERKLENNGRYWSLLTFKKTLGVTCIDILKV